MATSLSLAIQSVASDTRRVERLEPVEFFAVKMITEPST